MTGRQSIDSLDVSGVLDAAVEARRTADSAEADLLLLAAHFADLHPVADGGARAGFGDPTFVVAGPPGAERGRERLAPLAGAGTPAVAEFAPAELGAALGITGEAAKLLIGDALELRHRLPRLWSLVHEGRLQTWKARAVARETRDLSRDAAGFVDRHVAVVARRNRVPGPGQLNRLIHEALLRCDPDVAAAREQTALDRRGVWSSTRESTATTAITIVADTPDALAFEQTVGEVARWLGALGDPDSLDVRRARAVGVLADPQRSLELLAGDPLTERGAGRSGSISATLYLHLGPTDVVGHAEGLGALTRQRVRDWLQRADHVAIRPVMLAAAGGGEPAAEPAEGYAPPPVMAERVRLRDTTCVFPDCTVPSRACDLDHVAPYRPGTDAAAGGTHPENLAPLCRRHHRVKTHGRWTYRRNLDGSYTWTSPSGRVYTVESTRYGGTWHPPPSDPAPHDPQEKAGGCARVVA